MKAIVLGSNGYAGMLLLRILANHPEITSIVAASRSQSGLAIEEADPGLSAHILSVGGIGKTVLAPDDAVQESGDVAFSALPHGASAEVCTPLFGRIPVIDLSADFRFDDEERYRIAYGAPRPAPRYQDRSVYGLVEWYREQIPETPIIANPGCYPTATLLPLLPLAEQNLIDGTIITNALSGITGAGRNAKVNTLYGERTENANAYNPGRLHRHHAEIVERLNLVGRRVGSPGDIGTNRIELIFTPHLVPMKQGMAVTTVVPMVDTKAGIQAIADRYEKEPFVELTGTRSPETREVRGTNRIRIGWRQERDALILMSTIDNLWKGASGQAVQNMNVRFGLDETMGLLREGDL